MTIKLTTHEREVLLAESITIVDHEGDELTMMINYDSTDKPEGAAILEFIVTDKGERGTFVTADELEKMASIILNVAKGIRVANKKPPVQKRTRRK